MILDTSAIVAVLNKEPDSQVIEDVLASAQRTKVGAPTRAEAGIVLFAKFGVRGKTSLLRFLQELEIETLPFDENHANIAMDAFHRFGKGRHPAKLNMGDCFSYATAYLAREPLLCIGKDFVQTDLALVPLDAE
jgi:ribonuclease VapC